MAAFGKYFILPSSWILVGALAGIVLLCFRSTRKYGGVLGFAALTLYMFFGSGPVAFLLLGHLEYLIPAASQSEREGALTIVVLAAHAETEAGVPLSSFVNNASAVRLLEALSLFQAVPGTRVIVSGGGETPTIMRDVLMSAGIPPDRILVDGASTSTFESAIHLRPALENAPFLLVTSAGHMPRAIGTFLKAGANPRAVPTHFMTRRNWLAIQYLPSPVHLGYSDLAVSEYAALLWYRLRGWL